MSILEQIKKELPWLDDNLSFDLTRGKPSADQLKVTENIMASLALPFEMDGIDLNVLFLLGQTKLYLFQSLNLSYNLLVKSLI